MAEKDDVILKIKEKIAKLDKDSAKSYKEQLKALNDSNAALDTYKNLLGDINTRIDDQLQGFAGLLEEIKSINNELEKEGKYVRDATKAFRGLESVASKLKNDQKGYNELNKDQLQLEKSKLKILEDQFKEAAKQIQLRGAITDEEKAIVAAYESQNNQFERSLALLNDRIKQEDKLNKKLGVTGILLTGMSKIPIVGPLLKTNEALDAAREKAKAGGNAFQVMGAGLASMGENLLSSLSDPLVVIGLIIKGFQELIKLGFKLDTEVVGLQKAFYSSRVEAELLQERFQENVDTNNVLVKGLNESLLSRKNQTEAAIQLSNAMGAVGRLTDQEIQSQIKLTKQMGLSAEEGQALYVLGRQNKMTSSEVVDEITKQLEVNKKQTGVLLDAKKITQDVSKINGQLRLQYGNNVKQLASAVIQSNKLGFSLEQTKKIAEGLLNFEESIENELAAELLIGRDLNLEQARLLALNGESAKATALIAENMGGSAGFAAMNVLQQESLAKALGMSADELANSIMHQENLGKLKETDKKLLEDELARLKERGELEKAQQLEQAAANGANIASAIEALNKQDEFNNNVEKIIESLQGLLSGPAFQLAEWITTMVKNSETLQTVLKGVAYVVGGALLISLGKALFSMAALVAEAAAYAVVWAIANPVKALIGVGVASAVGYKIASETSSARASQSQATKTNFNEGGIVGGNSLTGDNQSINVNSGEMVLTRKQQAEFFNMIKNGGAGDRNSTITTNLILDNRVLATTMANAEERYSNQLGSSRSIANHRPS